MKNLLLSSLIFIGLMSPTGAQINQEVSPCGTTEKHREFYESLSPQEKIEYDLSRAAQELEIQEYIAAHPELMSDVHDKSVIYTIPVVFHIIHENGNENISNEQIENALNHMNQDFQKTNPDWQLVVDQFLPLVTDAQIEFKLAKRDNAGNCTNGITRTYTSQTSNGNANRAQIVQQAHGNWPGNKYLNIFIAKDIGGAAGYTSYPAGWSSNSMNNGIHVLHNYVGSIGTGGSHGTHTLSHEVGHWLNLAHLWGHTNDPGVASNCNTDDEVADTPNTIGWTSCNLSGKTCDNELDNVENFMEYSYCSKMFTHGQKARMHAALNASSTGRKNLWSAANLIATGVNLPDEVCTADFDAVYTEVCVGSEVEFKDLSYHAPTSWEWEFPGGSPSTSTQKNPTIQYNNPGTYQVKLKVKDANNNEAFTTKTQFITVLNHGAELPFEEGFEGSNVIGQTGWRVFNPGNNQTFAVTSDASYSGSKSIKLQNFGQPKGGEDELISQPIDLSGVAEDATVSISFKHSYRKRNASNNEKLKIYISNNCGQSWSLRDQVSGANLGNEISTGAWTPSSQSDWKERVTTNVSSAYFVDNLMVKFVFEADGGNNLFIDDINITATGGSVGIEEENIFSNLNVFPNPANDIANVTFSLHNNQDVEVELVNMMGQTIQRVDLSAQKGANQINLNTQDVEAGMYLVKVKTNGAQQVKRLIIQ